MKNSILITFLAAIFVLFLYSCDSTSKENKNSETEVINSKYSIASPEYEDLATNALRQIESFNFSKLEEMVSDDIEYYLPDGGEKKSYAIYRQRGVYEFLEHLPRKIRT